MPNWCSNTLTLQHEDPAMIRRARTAFSDGRLLDEFIPVPPELKISDSPGTKDLDLQQQYQDNQSRHGYRTWYDFCVNEWGTKWDVGQDAGITDVDDHMLCVYFDSAWAPPVGAYKKLEELGFRIDAMYYEPGIGFCGKYDEYGDDYYEMEGMNSSDVIDNIPRDIDEAFGISENMQMMEEEEPEPLTEWYVKGVNDKGLEK